VIGVGAFGQQPVRVACGAIVKSACPVFGGSIMSRLLTIFFDPPRHLFRLFKYFFDASGKIKDYGPPKIILLDLKWPKVSGIEVLKALKSNANTRKHPVIVMTSSKVESDLETCYILGVNSYIVKPVEFDQFAKKVKDVSLYWILVNTPPGIT
jgi:CheY-like chemotaxis protein